MPEHVEMSFSENPFEKRNSNSHSFVSNNNFNQCSPDFKSDIRNRDFSAYHSALTSYNAHVPSQTTHIRNVS